MTYTPKQFQEAINWDMMTTYGARSNQALTCRLGPFTVLQAGECDHETCYETHEWRFVFALGEQRFAREAEYSSYDGLKWQGSVFEVEPVEVVKTEWVKVEQVRWTAKQLADVLENTIFDGEDHGVTYKDNYKAPEQPWAPVTIDGWGEFANYIENGTLRIPLLRNLPITQESRRGEFELSSGIECVFTIGDQKFLKTGTWVSHDGAHWERGSLSEVEVGQKTVFYWKPVVPIV